MRRVDSPPGSKAFEPIGKSNDQQPVVIYLEEYEAIRMRDYFLCLDTLKLL